MTTLNTRQRITAFIDLTQALIEAIEQEQAEPLTEGAPAYRGQCRNHPDTAFPLRATRAGAREDTVSHSHTPGGHYVETAEITDWRTGLTEGEIDRLTTRPTTESQARP